MPIKNGRSTLSQSQPSVVVGIGASAGSARVIKSILKNLNPSDPFAYIVVQHLDQGGRGVMKAALEAASPLPVKEIKKGLKLKAGTLYWVSPHTFVSLTKEGFKTVPAESPKERLSVVDRLFFSLAEEWGSSTVGVLLSGDASDGALGIKMINDAGGLTLVQDPKSAEHPSMPQSAIATGAVDHIVVPEKIPSVIQKNARYINRVSGVDIQEELKSQISGALTIICELLEKYTQHDFKHYKTSTLVRRIQRRMHVLHLESVDAYIELLTSSPGEAESLFKEILINVTSFFRDKSSFKALEAEVLEKLVERAEAGQKIRVWVAGCSTGEEPYSIAILLSELASKSSTPPEFQVIATDIDSHALGVARKGSYSASALDDVSPEFIAKYFTKRGSRFHVTKQLRELCQFSIHNLVTDPPFSQIDLVCCRNVLIYLGSHLQKKLFPVFHYSLKKGGYLFLGTSESLTAHRDLFRTVNAKERIAQKKATAIPMPSVVPGSIHNYLSQFQDVPKDTQPDLAMIGQRIALDEIPLKYAIVNDEGHIVSGSPGISKYIEIGDGPFQNSVVKLCKPSIRPALRKAFALAKQEKRKITDETSTLETGNGCERVGIIVQPMPQLGTETGLYWIAFQYLGAILRSEQGVRTVNHADGELVDQLEREVFLLREELDKSVQDLEASNEELKSSNEELLSMNEELQSANEEMETSKEELQIVNEALQRANTDLENLLAGTQIATLFLDPDLRIRGFTPAISDIYRVKASDVDRDIRDFNSDAVDMPPYPLQAIEGQIEHEIRLKDGRIFERRVLPYRNHENVKDGTVVTFIDVTKIVTAEESRREALMLFETIANAAPALIWLSALDRRRVYFNRRWVEFTGQPMEDSLNEGWQSVVHPEDLESYMQTYNDHFDRKAEFYIEYRLRHHSGRYRWIGARGVPRFGVDGGFEGFIGACIDIHEQRQAREELVESERRLETMIRTSPSFMAILRGPQHVFEVMNDQYRILIGERDVVGVPLAEAIPEIQNQGFQELLDEVMRTGQPYVGKEVAISLNRRKGSPPERRYVDFVYQPYSHVEGKVEGILVHGVDVTEKVISRKAIENERQNFRNLFKQTPEMVCILSGSDHLFEFTNEAHVRALGFDATGKTVREAQPESVEVHGILDDVYRTGKTAELEEIAVTLGTRIRYFNLTYSARRNEDQVIDGIMILGTEVTAQVLTRESYKLQRDALQLALNSAPLPEILEVIAKMVELQAGGDLMASILLADKEGKHLLHGAAPSLPKAYNDAIHGVVIGPEVGSCGTASFYRKQVIVEDLEESPLWKNFRELIRTHGLRACWSTPIISSRGHLLGTFAFYSRTPRKPNELEVQFVEVASQITALIIDRNMEVSERLEREDQLAFATASANMGMWAVTLPDGKVSLSDEAARIFGFSKDYSHTDHAIDEFIHPDHREQAKAVLANAIATNSLYNDEYRIMRPDGEIRWINARGHVRLNERGEPYILSGLIKDITADKNAQFEINRSKKAAEAASAAKTLFLANMSHEIRTPLSAIVGFSDLLHSELPKTTTAAAYVDRISRNAIHLGRLIDELLDLSKIEAEKLEVDLRAFDFDNLIEDVHSTLALRAQSKGIALEFNWKTPKPSRIVSDPLRLSQIIVNIVGNAVKFTEHGSVHVDFSMVGDLLTIRVSDTGIGLTEAQQGRIFEPFVQADPSVSRKFGGTGLGLALSKRLAHLLGGDIILESSRLGEGTCFRIEIQTQQPKSTVLESRVKIADANPAEILKGKTLLVVDDSADNRLLVTLFLKGCGAHLIEASNGQEGVESALKNQPDLVLMDIQMPVLGGYDAMKKLKEAGFQSPVVALTAHAFQEERERCMALGFSGYVTKPISKAVLKDAINKLLKTGPPSWT